MLVLAQALGRLRLAARPGGERLHALDRHLRLLAEHPEHVGRLGQEPCARPHAIASQTKSVIAPSTPVAGSVRSHPTPIAPTTRQRMCLQRLRPPPTPTTEDATTWVV